MALARWVLDRPGLGWLRLRAGRWLEETHHAKVVSAEDARRIITLDEPITWKGLERVVPFAEARDVVLTAAPSITLAPCACRAVAKGLGEYDGTCGSTDSCIYVGDPIAEFVARKQPGARAVAPDEALSVLERAAKAGNIHTIWFKDAAGGRMYAICNCCSCCCIGMKAGRAGFSPIAASGYLAYVERECCTGCGSCVDACMFHAVAIDDGTATVDAAACMGCGVCVSVCPALAITCDPGGAVDPLPWPPRAVDRGSDARADR
jgi:ferredoxin